MSLSLMDELVESARARARKIPERRLAARPEPPSFMEALRGKSQLDVIAEYKQKSPSLGDIAARNVIDQVGAYERAGAAALSVLTEPTRFQGSYDDLEAAARTVSVPVLMKDFVVDPAQIREAAYLGASAVLLIVRCLSPNELTELARVASEHRLTPLVECHDASEIARALAIEDAVIGVNNRDLDTLEIDRSLAPRLLAEVPSDRVVVAESGYLTADDVRDVCGVADAVLIGSALMQLDDPATLIEQIHRERSISRVKPFIKICGLTRLGDASLAVSLGATHIGAVRTPSSPRCVTPEHARDIFAAAEGKAETVLVCKDIPLAQVVEDARASGAMSVQLYDASAEDVRSIASEGYRVFRVYPMESDSRSLPPFDPPPTAAQPALLDVGGGGSGRRFDWTLFGERAPEATFVAGGIRPDNVRALLKYGPYGVDLASGVESAPGIKDEQKLRTFFEEVS